MEESHTSRSALGTARRSQAALVHPSVKLCVPSWYGCSHIQSVHSKNDLLHICVLAALICRERMSTAQEELRPPCLRVRAYVLLNRFGGFSAVSLAWCTLIC